MSGSTDFDRLGDLLGEACGAPPRPQGASRGLPGQADHIQLPGSSPGQGAGADPDALRVPARLLAVIWPELVGDEVAANAQPVQLNRGRLVVSASSSAWAQTLQLMGDAIAARINERLGEGVVERVVFRHAGWEERPAGRSSARAATGRHPGRCDVPPTPATTSGDSPDPEGGGGTLSAEQKAVLAEVETLDLDPDLRDQIARAMEAAFVRGQADSVR
ncbi:MAG: DUF721 domain-containing protein [bacterium]